MKHLKRAMLETHVPTSISCFLLHKFGGKALKFIVLLLILSTCFSGFTYAVEVRQFLWHKAYFYNFYSVCPLKSGDVWAVGSNGMICHMKDNYKWDIQESNLHGNLYSVSFVDAENGWVCGQNGQIINTTDGGKSWQVQKSGIKTHLFSIIFKNSRKGWAVGEFGTVLNTNDGGRNWHAQGKKVDKIYNNIYFYDTEYGWIVGEFGTILHTVDGGKNWIKQKNPLGEKTLFNVYFSDRENGWATGMDGTILNTKDGGKNWSAVKSSIKENLMCIQVIGNNGWIIGLKGTYGMLDKDVWSDQTHRVPTRAWLKDCVFINEKTGWIAGSVGTLLHTLDGGETWLPAAKSGK